jgi:hypothetical protein
MIDKPDQAEGLTLTRRQWVRVAAALAIRTYTDPRLQDLATLFGEQVAVWEQREPDEAYVPMSSSEADRSARTNASIIANTGSTGPEHADGGER